MADTVKLPPGYEDYVPASASNVKLPPGYENYVKDTTDAGIEHPTFAKAGLFDKPEGPDLFRHYVGNPVSHSLSGVGGALGGVAGEGIASVPLAAAGAGLGSSIGNKLRQISPRLFGQPSDSPGTDSIVDAVLQGAAPEAGGLALKNAPGLLARVASKFPAGKEFLSNDTAAGVYDKALSYLKPTETERVAQSIAKKPLLPSMDAYAQQEARQFNADLATKQATHSEQVTKLFDKGLNPSAKTFDASKVIDELAKNPKSYEGIDPTARKGIETFLQTANAVKPMQKIGDQSVLGYNGTRLVINAGRALGGAAVGGYVGGATGAVLGAAGGLSLSLGNAQIAKVLADPAKAALFTQALKTPITSPQSSLIGKALMFALRGSEVYALTPDDKPVKAYVNEKGDLTYATRP